MTCLRTGLYSLTHSLPSASLPEGEKGYSKPAFLQGKASNAHLSWFPDSYMLPLLPTAVVCVLTNHQYS